jgi:HEAT repeat protein
MEAAAMLSIKNDPAAIPELAKQLNAYNSNVRVAAISAIGALATSPQEVLTHLAHALKDEDAFVRVNAAMAMFDIAQRHRNPHQNLKDLCLKALKDPNVYVVKNAARTLGLVGDEEALREIIALFKQEHRPEITANLVHALGLFEDPRSFKTLSKALKHKAWEVRFEAINALSLLKDKRAYSLFLQGLKDPSVMVQEQAVRALGALGNKKAITALEKLKMQHPYGSINKFINQALDKLLSF